MHPFGDARIVDSVIRHIAGPRCAAIPRSNWDLPLSQLRVVAEYTTPAGPVFDFFYVFVAGEPARMFELPMEAFEQVGIDVFFRDLERGLKAPVVERLAGSVAYASNIMWPEVLAGEPFFGPSIKAPRNGRIGRLVDRFSPRYEATVSDAVIRFVGTRPEWAV